MIVTVTVTAIMIMIVTVVVTVIVTVVIIGYILLEVLIIYMDRVERVWIRCSDRVV